MEYLAHHGIKGQKWGVRRFQNEDGTLTEAGKKRYAKSKHFTIETANTSVFNYVEKNWNSEKIKKLAKLQEQDVEAYNKWYNNQDSSQSETLKSKLDSIYQKEYDSAIPIVIDIARKNGNEKLADWVQNLFEEDQNIYSTLEYYDKKSANDFDLLYLFLEEEVTNRRIGFYDNAEHSVELNKDEYLAHYGVLGQKRGKRRYQYEDGSLTPLGRIHYGVGLGSNRNIDSSGRLTAQGYQKVAVKQWQDDTKWLKKNDARIRKQVEREVRPYLKATERQLKQEIASKYKSGTKSKNYINAYNKRMAEIMNMAVDDLPTPNENAIRFVAKRGSLGVYTALTTQNYNINSLKNGIYTSGRVAYRKDVVDKEWD